MYIPLQMQFSRGALELPLPLFQDLRLNRGYTLQVIYILSAYVHHINSTCMSIYQVFSNSQSGPLHEPTNGSSDILPHIPRSLPERYLFGFLALDDWQYR